MAQIKRAAKALIRRKSDGKYLILTCSLWPENPRRSQKPDLPGGSIKRGENIEDGLLREILEETGLSIVKETLQLGYCATRFVRGDSENFLLYVVEIEGNEPIILSWEHESYQWMSAGEVRALKIRSPYRKLFRYLVNVELLI
jgi:8-oxo-dGTP pyrophosphatase MutT (NUDIX family)